MVPMGTVLVPSSGVFAPTNWLSSGALVVANEGDVLVGRRIGHDAIVRHRHRVGHLAFAAGNHQREILHDVRRIHGRSRSDGVGLGGDGVDVHARGPMTVME